MATKQELHLERLNQEYSRFVKDQVLTEVQLNEIIDFFEDQHRLTRTCLLGTGIICGLELSRTLNTVTLSPGVAVTTDGDLLRPPLQTYRYFTVYTPPDNSHYDPFYYRSGATEKMLTLYQLLTEEEKNALNSQEYQPITELNAVISGWVAILYLEYYVKNPVRCTATDCDNLGVRQKATPKLLICSREDMDKLIHKDADETIGDDLYQKYYEAYTQYFKIPIIKPKRVLFGTAATQNSITLAKTYFAAAKDGTAALTAALRDLYKAFQLLIDPDQRFQIDTLTRNLSQILSTGTDIFAAQYTYDFYKDVVAAYNELREILYNTAFECQPNLYAFPKHIMLGAPGIRYDLEPPAYRHQFYPSPAVSTNRSKVEAAASMLNRLRLLIETFKPQVVEKIRITPSRDYNHELAERAIPFYYADIRRLAPAWSHRKNLRNQVKHNLSYNAGQYAPPVPEETLNPLDYDIDPYDFFRIEGHMGRPFRDVLKELNELRTTKEIPFDLVAVRLGDAKLSDIDLNDFSCHFDDLNTMLKIFQADMNCIIAEGVTFFSGFTTSPDKPHVNMEKADESPVTHPWQISEEQFVSATRPAQTLRPEQEPVSRTVIPERKGLQTMSQPLFADPATLPLFSTKRFAGAYITSDEQSIGRYMIQAMEREPASADDFVEKTRSRAMAANALVGLSTDDQFVLFEYPTQIIGHLNALQQFIPSSLDRITADLIRRYREFNRTFYNLLKAVSVRLQNHFTTPGYVQLGYETKYLNMLDTLSQISCNDEKLEVIFSEIEQRKATLLERLSFTLFRRQHPGLEHKGGTHRGGTFVLVYADTPAITGPQAINIRAIDSDNRQDNDSLQKVRKESTPSPYQDAETFVRYIASNADTVNTERELARFLEAHGVRADTPGARSLIREVQQKTKELTAALQEGVIESEQAVIVADFCLPYLCCSDCPPTAFIIHREKRILALPTALACAADAPIPFSLYSPKGAIIGSAEAPMAITQGENPTFDPGKVPASQIGKPITFTLDGDTTDCVIAVRKPLTLQLSAEVRSSDRTGVVIVYTNRTDEGQSGENTYIWTFNDRSTETTRGKVQLVKTFNREGLAAAGITTVVATVTVLDDPCNSTATVSVRVPEPVADTCQDTVLDFITAATNTLTSDTFRALLDSINQPDIMRLYADLLQLLDRAVTTVKENDPGLREKALQQASELLQQVYPFKFPRDVPEQLPRALEEFLRILLMLMLNLVRCDEKLSDIALRIILENLDRFVEQTNWLHTYYPQLDANDILQGAIKEYEASLVSQHADIIRERLQRVLETLDLFT
ncbi:MAG: hypothetical protein GXY53_09625 [Desulfobulbus sp.]|nr:hypothetical protein [Desulfobulbus sp.]